MIPYNKNAFGLNLIFRVHGSAVYRSIVPSLVSVGFYFCIRRLYDSASDDFGQEVGHPYAIGVLVGSTTFLLVFRASQGYNRYWEGATSVGLGTPVPPDCGSKFHLILNSQNLAQH